MNWLFKLFPRYDDPEAEMVVAQKFFKDCEDFESVINKYTYIPNNIRYTIFLIHLQSVVLEKQSKTIQLQKEQLDNFAELLSSYNSNTTVSKTGNYGAEPYDSASPPYGQS